MKGTSNKVSKAKSLKPMKGKQKKVGAKVSKPGKAKSLGNKKNVDEKVPKPVKAKKLDAKSLKGNQKKVVPKKMKKPAAAVKKNGEKFKGEKSKTVAAKKSEKHPKKTYYNMYLTVKTGGTSKTMEFTELP